MKNHNIAMICDYFYPSLGGIETHIELLSKELIKQGHHVIIITHKYSNGKENISGLRYLKINKLDEKMQNLNCYYCSNKSNTINVKNLCYEDEFFDSKNLGEWDFLNKKDKDQFFNKSYDINSDYSTKKFYESCSYKNINIEKKGRFDNFDLELEKGNNCKNNANKGNKKTKREVKLIKNVGKTTKFVKKNNIDLNIIEKQEKVNESAQLKNKYGFHSSNNFYKQKNVSENSDLSFKFKEQKMAKCKCYLKNISKDDDKYTNCIPVYYLNIPVIAMNTSFPSILSYFPLLYKIFKKEKITVVHGHQTYSNLSLESIFHAKTMGIKTVLTEHSLFEVGGLENIVVNRLAQLVLRGIDRYICVSYTCKQNLIDRISVPSDMIYVIPNAVSGDIFYPRYISNKEKIHHNSKKIIKERKNINKLKNQNSYENLKEKYRKIKDARSKRKLGKSKNKLNLNDKITIIVLSRLVSRKGIDIFINILPKICKISNKINVTIGGDGPKRHEIDQKIDEHGLYAQVKVLGEVDHKTVPEVLRSGDIFLNTSLTEAFCMAILEAATCGLQVVSTNVGGIHEVLPENIAILTGIKENEILDGLVKAIRRIIDGRVNKYDNHLKCVNAYSWSDIATETVKIYDKIKTKKIGIAERIKFYNPVYDIIFIFCILYEYVIFSLLEYFE